MRVLKYAHQPRGAANVILKIFFIYQINIDIIVPYLSLTENSKLNKPFFKLIPSFKNIKNNKNNAYFGVEMLFLEFHQSKDAQIKF